MLFIAATAHIPWRKHRHRVILQTAGLVSFALKSFVVAAVSQPNLVFFVVNSFVLAAVLQPMLPVLPIASLAAPAAVSILFRKPATLLSIVVVPLLCASVVNSVLG